MRTAGEREGMRTTLGRMEDSDVGEGGGWMEEFRVMRARGRRKVRRAAGRTEGEEGRGRGEGEEGRGKGGR